MTIEELTNRPKAYYNVDGVGELGMSFMCLGYGLLGWMQVQTPKEAIWHQMYAFVIYVGVMLSIIHYGSKAIKKHITFPRTGFVEYRRDTRWRPMIIAGVVGALVSIALVAAFRSHWDLTAPVSLSGLFLAACYARGFASAVGWKWAMVGLMAAGSVAIPALPADLVVAVADHSRSAAFNKAVGAFYLLFLFYGVLLMVSGGISLWLYLRHTQAPATETA